MNARRDSAQFRPFDSSPAREYCAGVLEMRRLQFRYLQANRSLQFATEQFVAPLGIATLPGYFDPAAESIVRMRARTLSAALAAAAPFVTFARQRTVFGLDVSDGPATRANPKRVRAEVAAKRGPRRDSPRGRKRI